MCVSIYICENESVSVCVSMYMCIQVVNTKLNNFKLTPLLAMLLKIVIELKIKTASR